MSEERIIELETRVAFQEHSLQELNDALCSQQEQIRRLEILCRHLQNQIRDMEGRGDGGTAVAQERPPHY